MKIYYLLFFSLVLLLSCEEKTLEAPAQDDSSIEENLPLDELAKRRVESQLSIPGSEKYKLEIHPAQFDADGIEDAVILVNRQEYAYTSTKEEHKASRESVGYTGNYNYLFYYDGATKKVSRPIALGSSPFSALKIDILNIHSDGYKDFTLDYRIMENCYRNVYTIFRGVPKLVFQWPVFLLEKANEKQINFFEYAQGSYSSAKDIVISEGKMDNELPENLVSDFNYSITKSGQLIHQFFYNPKEGKYFTNK